MTDLNGVRLKNRVELAKTLSAGVMGLTIFAAAPIIANEGLPIQSELLLYLGHQMERLPIVKIGLGIVGVYVLQRFMGLVPRSVTITEADVRAWRVFLGIGRNGKRYYHNFNEIPHLKAGGVTGSGKSKGLELLLAQIIRTKKPSEVECHIIDLKGGATFAHYTNCPHVAGRIYSTPEEALNALDTVWSTMEERLKQIRQARASFREIPYFPRIMLFIDEGGELSPAYAHNNADKKLRQQCLAALSSIARVGREPKISLIYSTQRPSNESLPVGIRGQMDGTMGYRTQNELDSNILLRNEHAAGLKNIKGRMLYQTPDGEYEVQTAIIPDHVVKRWIMESGAPMIYDIPPGDARIKDEPTTADDPVVCLDSPSTTGDWGK